VPLERAGGGIIITASHNPKQWNALKLLNASGEFISDVEGKEVLELAETMDDLDFAEVSMPILCRVPAIRLRTISPEMRASRPITIFFLPVFSAIHLP